MAENDLSAGSAPSLPLSGPLVPFEPVLAEKPPEGERWLAQVKWDGVRMLTYFDGGSTRLFNRKRNERTAQYPELSAASSYCRAKSAVLDGEIVALQDGKPSFQRVMSRDNRRAGPLGPPPAIMYMVFDLLMLNGESLLDRPLHARQRLLSEALITGEHVQQVTSFPDPAQLYAATKQIRLEGIVVKDIDSSYAVGGKDKRWQKLKHYRNLAAVVGGVTFTDGLVRSLLLGLYDDNEQLHYIGNAGSSRFTGQIWRAFTEAARLLEAPASPFQMKPSRSEPIMWIKPQLVVDVTFLEWTSHGTLRQPLIERLSAADPRSCVFSRLT